MKPLEHCVNGVPASLQYRFHATVPHVPDPSGESKFLGFPRGRLPKPDPLHAPGNECVKFRLHML